MDKVSIFLEANKQNLRVTNVYKLVEKTVNYIEACFTLSDEWQSFGMVQAIWSGAGKDIVTLLDESGVIFVPHEVLAKPGLVRVNLVGSDFSINDDELQQRLTTEQIVCIQVKAKALIDGDNTEIEPSIFEKFVAEIHEDADRAEESANRAEAAKEAIAGDMSFGIDENGDLIYHWTNNVTVDFYLLDGDLYLEEDY